MRQPHFSNTTLRAMQHELGCFHCLHGMVGYLDKLADSTTERYMYLQEPLYPVPDQAAQCVTAVPPENSTSPIPPPAYTPAPSPHITTSSPGAYTAVAVT